MTDNTVERGGAPAHGRHIDMVARKARIAVLAIAVTAAVSALGAGPAGAGVLVASAGDCTSPDSSEVFAPWMDPASYFLAPDGGFESGAAGWALDGASVAAANSSYQVSGSGTQALALPSGSAATTPTICVGLEHPTIRFFARRTSGGSLSSLRVDALIEDNLGAISTVPVGVTGASGAWQPGPQMVVAASLLPLLPGDHTPVAFRFTAQGGSYLVDDVYVDPYAGR
jgi:hypothetical protein